MGMRFADPQACPDCRGAIAGQPACPHCGLDLTSVEVRQLWQVLLQADDLLGRAARRPRAAAPGRAAAHPAPPAPAPSTPAPPVPSPSPPPQAPAAPAAPSQPPPPFVPGPATPVFPAPPPPQPAAEPVPAAPGAGPQPAPDPAWRMRPPEAAPTATDRSWSVGTILLVLGAFGLVVAASIFVTRSWEDIGLAGRTLILLAVTTVFGGLGVWVTRRPLRASAEAVWSVFLALLTLDFFAARHEDLVGLGALEVAGGWLVWGVVALALAAGISAWARPHVRADLVVPAVAGGIAITVAGVGAGAIGDDWDFAWRALLALVVAGVLALATRPVGSASMTSVARVVVAGFYVFAYGAAVVELLTHPALDDVARGGHGGPLLLMVVASVVIASVVPVVRIPAVALAVVGASALVVTPAVEAGSLEVAWAVLSVLAVVLTAATSRGSTDWMRGARAGAVPAVAAVAVVQLVLVGEALGTAGSILDNVWRSSWSARLDATVVDDHAAWVVPVVLVGLLATTWWVTAWPELAPVRARRGAVLGSTLALGSVTSVVALRPAVWGVAAVLLLLAAAAAWSRLRPGAEPQGPASVPTPVALALVLAASALALASHGVSAATWLVGGVVLGAVALASRDVGLARAHAAIGTGLLVAGAAATVGLLDVDDSVVPPLVAVVVALLLMAAARLVRPDHPVSPAVEIAAGVALAGALLVPAGSGGIAVRWTVAGVGLIALALVAGGRRWLVWPGMSALVVAYVALIVDSGFSFVEAYTLPLGAAALAAGVWATARRPDASTWTLLGPGLALALLPSVPQSLADPTGLRALLLGLGALVVLAVAVRLGWQAPFVAGTSILLLIVLFNIGPYANAAPRVVLIAVVSAVLLGIGITWEDRVRDGRKLVAYVRSMR
ncbi:hypothetical protein ASD10_13005 [Aeromicrobium sp. Root472D3]|nr:hypothetical protein ASD10_13005 [Aeromicrobium sp. Root472D3]